MKNEILNILYTYWPAISAAILEIVLRLWPTTKNYSIIDLALKLAGYILQLTQKGTEKLIPNRMKNTLKVIAILFLFSFSVNAQLNGNFKTVRLTTGISQSDTTTKAVNGQIYYNHNTNRFRARQNNAWVNLISGGGGGGGLSTASNGLNVVGNDVRLGGVLTANTTLSGAFNLDFTNTLNRFNSGTLSIFNPARTFTYNIQGAAITGNRILTIPLLSANADIMTSTNAQSTAGLIPFQTALSIYGANSLFNYANATNILSTPIISTTGNATNANLRLAGLAVAPSTLANGDVWYNTGLNKFQFRENGLTVQYTTLPEAGIISQAVASEVGRQVRQVTPFASVQGGTISGTLISAVPNNTTILVELTVLAQRTDFTYSYAGKVTGAFRNNAGTLTQIGTTQQNILQSAGTVTYTLSATGGNIDYSATTGQTGTINHNIYLQYTRIN
jgi:hypothetical protein